MAALTDVLAVIIHESPFSVLVVDLVLICLHHRSVQTNSTAGSYSEVSKNLPYLQLHLNH